MSVNRVKRHSRGKLTKWDVLIADAERRLTEAKIRVAGLEKAVKNFKELRDSGTLWPGEQQKSPQEGG